MPHDKDTSLGRIDVIERNLQKLRRDTSRLTAMTTRNREDLGHALADLDELLYAALATGHEITIGNPRPDTLDRASGAETDPPRCTNPRHHADPPAARPTATHVITLRTPHAGQEDRFPPLPHCADCAAEVLKSPAAPRVNVRRMDDDQRANAPRCQSPVHFADDAPAATTIIVTAGVRPGIRYCDACAETTRATLQRHKIPCESAAIVPRRRTKPRPGAGRR
jgi:hypothetical protein